MANRDHPLYVLWRNIRTRCNTKSATGYASYGGRGIKVAPEWDDFWKFVADMGPRPTPKHSIDRIDNSQGYAPGNCRWATQAEQNRNSRIARYITFRGQRLCVTDWAAKFGVTQSAMSHRIRKYGEQRAIEMGHRRSP